MVFAIISRNFVLIETARKIFAQVSITSWKSLLGYTDGATTSLNEATRNVDMRAHAHAIHRMYLGGKCVLFHNFLANMLLICAVFLSINLKQILFRVNSISGWDIYMYNTRNTFKLWQTVKTLIKSALNLTEIQITWTTERHCKVTSKRKVNIPNIFLTFEKNMYFLFRFACRFQKRVR